MESIVCEFRREAVVSLWKHDWSDPRNKGDVGVSTCPSVICMKSFPKQFMVQPQHELWADYTPLVDIDQARTKDMPPPTDVPFPHLDAHCSNKHGREWLSLCGQISGCGTLLFKANKIFQVDIVLCCFFAAILMTMVIILFGVMAYYDPLWMPHPELNYLSWSYGLAVLTAFFNIFASIAQGVYTAIERQELREPPAQVMGGMMPPAYSTK